MMGFWLTERVLEVLATELLAALPHARVQQVKQAGPRSVVIELHLHGTTRALVLHGDAPVAFGLRAEPPRRAEATPPAFQGLLRKHLANTRLNAVLVDVKHACVRVSFATLSVPMHLVLEWGRNAPNVLLVHDNGTLMGAAHTASLQPRGLRVGQKYAAAPSSPGEDAAVPEVSAEVISAHALRSTPMHALLDHVLSQGVVQTPQPVVSPWRKRLKSELDKVLRLVRALESDVVKSAGSSALRTAADLAKRKMQDMPRGADEWVLRDPYVEDAPEISVRVDPALSA